QDCPCPVFFKALPAQFHGGGTKRVPGENTRSDAAGRIFSTDQRQVQPAREAHSGFNCSCKKTRNFERASIYHDISCIFFRFRKDRDHFCQPLHLFLPPAALQALQPDRRTWADLPVPPASPEPDPLAESGYGKASGAFLP